MKRVYIRSIIYNICFYGLTAVACFACLPALILPRGCTMAIVAGFVSINAFLERNILGLRYEVRGLENLPKDGSYIVAAKHQSAYETLKLHMLFKNPAIILKKELLRIPLWGQYLAKTDVIAIDRSSREAASKSIQDGAIRVKEQGRPIIIFPQGTRVSVDATTGEKPYKVGVARMQEATGLPIIPMAMNAGMFWPRNGFWKSSGTVIFEFLPPIKPGLERAKLMKKLEKEVETASLSLMNEAREKAALQKSGWAVLFSAFVLLTGLFGIYSVYWFKVAEEVESTYYAQLYELYGDDAKTAPAVITGFPGPMAVSVNDILIKNEINTLNVEALRVQSWPFPGMKMNVRSGPLLYQDARWEEPLRFDSLSALISVDGQVLSVYESLLLKGDFIGSVVGLIDFSQVPFPKLDIVLNMDRGEILVTELAALGLIDKQAAMFLSSGMQALKDQETGIVSMPIHQKGRTLMAGPLPVMTLPIYDVKNPPRRTRPAIPSQPVSGPIYGPFPVSPDASAPDSDSLQDPTP